MDSKRRAFLTLCVLLAVLWVTSVPGITDLYVIRSDSVGQDKWFGTYYVRTGRNDDILKVGGWGDAYYTLIQMPVHFSVPGRKIIKKATLNLHSFGSDRPTTMRMYLVRGSWSEVSTVDHWGLTINDHGQVPAPPAFGNYSIDITSEFFKWITGAEPNYGILLTPENNDNRFNYFLSSENARSYLRPSITVEYERVPKFKMPLPGGKYWKCSTAAGGSPTHLGQNFYAVDFSYKHYDENQNLIENKIDIPVLAAADGVIIEVGNTAANGNYVKIDHDKDLKYGTGFQSVYLHMKENTVAGKKGDQVRSGDLLGIMGDTGQSEGVHLHFQLYFEQKGSVASGADNIYLNSARVEGSWAMTDFVENRFYESQNTHWSF